MFRQYLLAELVALYERYRFKSSPLCGKVDPADPRLPEFRQTFQQITGQEYSDQLVAAMRKDVGVKRNEDAIKAAANRLKGGN